MSDDFADQPPTDELVIGGPEAPKNRRSLWIGGGVLGVLAVGGGAAVWAATSFLSQGSQPAEALPASTIGYVSIDLDPSGSQKIAALKLARKFPAFKDEVGLGTEDDVRQWIIDKALDDADCDLDFDKDLAPWLGSRAALAAVGSDDPKPVAVVQTTDRGKAETGLEKLTSCGTAGEDAPGWVIDGDWIVFAETEDAAKKVVAETDKGSLADDADFATWTDKAGDSGILTAYAAPAAGKAIADQIAADDGATAGVDPFGACPGAADQGEATDRLRGKLADFRGAAATLRFGDDGLELESVGDLSSVANKALGKPEGTPVVTTLPADTALAFGLSYPKGWSERVKDGLTEVCGDDADPDALLGQLSTMLGLDLPGDVETLFGSSAALALGPGLDVESLVNSGDPSGLPVALKVRGDADAISDIATKLRASIGAPEGVLEPVTGDGVVAFGLDEDYASEVAKGGKLGSAAAFTSVVPHADDANAVLFVNFDALDGAIEALSGGDNEVSANLKPLRAIGFSSWPDGDDVRSLVKISVD
jgi:hypothetical protein